MKATHPSWLKAILSWVFLLLAIGVVYGQLVSGYSATLPIIGRVPGPPSPFVHKILNLSFLISVIMAALSAIPVLMYGSWTKRLIAAIPFLCTIGVAVLLIERLFH